MSAVDPNKTSTIKHDWYQSETHVVITILLKNADKEKVLVNYDTRKVSIVCPIPNSEETYSLELNLAHSVVVEDCKHVVTASKIEIKLRKKDGLMWPKLEGKAEDDNIKQIAQVVTLDPNQPAPKYPSSSRIKKDWDKIEKEIIQGEADDKPPVNELFQKIYGEGNDDVRKAMNKSYMESGGTVLSTNWNEVSKKKVPVKAPDGLEYKKWD